MVDFKNYSEDEIENRIVTWLLNGVTFREVEERLGWLGIVITYEEILKITRESNKPKS